MPVIDKISVEFILHYSMAGILLARRGVIECTPELEKALVKAYRSTLLAQVSDLMHPDYPHCSLSGETSGPFHCRDGSSCSRCAVNPRSQDGLMFVGRGILPAGYAFKLERLQLSLVV